LHIHLGVTEKGRLFTFAEEGGFTTYFDVFKGRPFTPENFADLMNKADKIHFNTEGFDFLRFARWAQHDGGLWMTRGYTTVTNYELREVMTNSAWAGKVVFH
jgi:hypothetical protein